jgi:hypothetical protein
MARVERVGNAVLSVVTWLLIETLVGVALYILIAG